MVVELEVAVGLSSEAEYVWMILDELVTAGQTGLGCQNEVETGFNGKRLLHQITHELRHGWQLRTCRKCLIHAHCMETGEERLSLLC